MTYLGTTEVTPRKKLEKRAPPEPVGGASGGSSAAGSEAAAPEKLAEELRSFGEKFPNHPLAMEFLRAARMEEEWKAADSWHEMAKEEKTSGVLAERLPMSFPPRVSDRATAARRLKDIEEHLNLFPGSPYKDIAEKYLKYLAAAQGAFTDAGLKHLTATEELLLNPLVSAVSVVRDTSGRAYYTYARKLAEHRVDGRLKLYTFSYVVDGTGKRRQCQLRPEELKGSLQAAPQTFFAAQALNRIQKFRGQGWETFYLELAELAGGKNIGSPRGKTPDVFSSIDPILHARLLRELLGHAVGTTPFRAEQVALARRPLEGVELDVAWMRPEDLVVERARSRAAAALARVKPLAPLIQAIEQALEAMKEPLRPYRPVAVLLRSGGEVRMGPVAGQGGIYVLHRNGILAFRRIGRLVEGEAPVIGSGAAARFPQGSIVYLRAE